MTPVSPGQIWRDTYYDAPARGEKRSERTIRVISPEPDGRWLVQAVTDHNGAAVVAGRKTRVSEKTLAAGYEFIREDGAND